MHKRRYPPESAMRKSIIWSVWILQLKLFSCRMSSDGPFYSILNNIYDRHNIQRSYNISYNIIFLSYYYYTHTIVSIVFDDNHGDSPRRFSRSFVSREATLSPLLYYTLQYTISLTTLHQCLIVTKLLHSGRVVYDFT